MSQFPETHGVSMRRTRQAKGQSITEFALIVPILLMVILGTFDLGYAVYASNTLALSAREGARMGIIRSNGDAQICQRVTDSAIALGNVTCSVTARTMGAPFTVRTTFAYSPFTPFVGRIIGNGGSITLVGQSTMVAE